MTKGEQVGPQDWQGERGVRWLRDMAGFEAMLQPLGEALMARAALAPGERVVDIGCGGGWTSRAAAAQVGPRGSVCGVDISALLLREAARRAAAMPNLTFVRADASADAVPGAPFDRMISRLGVMFFVDPAAAFARLRRLLVPGGRMDWAVWGPKEDNPWMFGARAVTARHLELPPPDPGAPGPFTLTDRDRLADLLAGAGFVDIEIVEHRHHVAVGGAADPAAAADFAAGAFFFSDAIEAADAATRAAIHDDLVAFYRDFMTADGLAVPARAWLVRAVASSGLA